MGKGLWGVRYQQRERVRRSRKSRAGTAVLMGKTPKGTTLGTKPGPETRPGLEPKPSSEPSPASDPIRHQPVSKPSLADAGLVA